MFEEFDAWLQFCSRHLESVDPGAGSSAALAAVLAEERERTARILGDEADRRLWETRMLHCDCLAGWNRKSLSTRLVHTQIEHDREFDRAKLRECHAFLSTYGALPELAPDEIVDNGDDAAIDFMFTTTTLDLSGRGLKALPDCLRHLRRLRSIDLSGNPLREVPPAIWALPHLIRLSVIDCPLDRIGIGGAAAARLQWIDLDADGLCGNEWELIRCPQLRGVSAELPEPVVKWFRPYLPHWIESREAGAAFHAHQSVQIEGILTRPAYIEIGDYSGFDMIAAMAEEVSLAQLARWIVEEESPEEWGTTIGQYCTQGTEPIAVHFTGEEGAESYVIIDEFELRRTSHEEISPDEVRHLSAAASLTWPGLYVPCAAPYNARGEVATMIYIECSRREPLRFSELDCNGMIRHGRHEYYLDSEEQRWLNQERGTPFLVDATGTEVVDPDELRQELMASGVNDKSLSHVRQWLATRYPRLEAQERLSPNARLLSGKYWNRRVASYHVPGACIGAGLHPRKYVDHFAGTKETLFIDLTTEIEKSEDYVHPLQAARSKRDERLFTRSSYPIDPGEVCSHAMMNDILDALDAAMARNEWTYIHGRDGNGRAATVIGCWLTRHGRSGAEALAEVDALVRTTEEGDYRAYWKLGPSQTAVQRELVLNWAT